MNINDRLMMTSFIQHWGEDLQIIVTMEECAELIQVLSKWIRAIHNKFKTRDEYIEEITEEIVDVSLMLEQLKVMFGIPSKEFQRLLRVKMDRTYERYEKELEGEKEE